MKEDRAISLNAILEFLGDTNMDIFTDEVKEFILQLPSVTPQEQVVGDLISRTELLKALETWDRFGVDDTNSLFRLDNLSLPHYVPYIHYDDVVKCIKGMPSVAIPQDHDGCKDCRHQAKGEDELPCRECQQNYMDKWQKKPHWTKDFICSDCGCKCYPMDIDFGDYNYCPNCGAKMVEPQEGFKSSRCPLKSSEELINVVNDVYINMIGSADDTELACLVKAIKKYCEVNE